MKDWESFLNENIYWPLNAVPMNETNIILAIATGDAKVEMHVDNWGAEVYFKWLRPVDKRTSDYKVGNYAPWFEEMIHKFQETCKKDANIKKDLMVEGVNVTEKLEKLNR